MSFISKQSGENNGLKPILTESMTFEKTISLNHKKATLKPWLKPVKM